MIYPGDAWCNPSQYAHAKWHHESAVGLLDLIYTCDNVYRLTLQSMSTSTSTQSTTASIDNPTTTSAGNGNLLSHFCLLLHLIILLSIALSD